MTDLDKTTERATAESPRPVPAEPFSTLRRQIDRLIDDFQGAWPGWGRSLWDSDLAKPVRDWVGGNWGAVDVSETPDAYRIAVEFPGCEEKDIDVTLANGTLTVKAEKRREQKEERESYHLSERAYGSLHRSFRVPAGVSEEAITAVFKNGVLELTLPKSDEAKQQARRIAVKKE